MSDTRRNSEDALSASSCPTSSRAAQRVAFAMQHRRSESASTSATVTPPTFTRRHPYTSSSPPLDISFDADSDVSGPSTRPSSWNIPRHNPRDASPEASTPSTRSPSTSPVSRLPYPLTSSTPDRSISSVLESSRRWDSPQTPQTPGAGSSAPSTTSPVSRAKPRFKHSSSDTPLRKSTDSSTRPVQTLPFPLTAMQDKYQQNGGPKVARVRFSDAHPRSMPKLSAATFAPPSPVRANTSPSMLLAPNGDSQSSRSRSDSASRRRSAQASSTAVTTPGTESWQRKVAEEMIRLSFAPTVSTANSNTSNPSSLSSTTGKRNSRHSTGTRSSGEFQQLNLDPRLAKLNQPTTAPKVVPPVPFPSSGVGMKQINAKPRTRPTRSNTTPSPKKSPFEPAVTTNKDKENAFHRQRKLSLLVRNAAAAAAEPLEVRVVKQESFDHSNAIGINAQQWRLDVDVPTPSLGIPVPSGSEEKAAGPSSTRILDDEGDAVEEEPVLKPRPRQTRRSVRSRNSSGARSVGAARAAAATTNSSTPDITEEVATGTGTGNGRKSTGSSSIPSLNTRLNALRQTSHNTLQQSPASSSHVPSSPDDSPTPSRRRLSSYVIEPTALFFAPRAHPPPPDEEEQPMNNHKEVEVEEQRERGRLPRISTGGLALPRPSSGSILDQQSTTSASVVPSSRPTSSYVTAPQSAISTPRPSNSTSRPSLRNNTEPPAAKDELVMKGKGKRVYEGVDPEGGQQPGASAEGGHHLGNGLVIPSRQRLESNMTRYTDDDTIGELPESNNPRKRLKMSSSAHLVQTLSEAVAARSSPDSSYEQQQQPSPSEQVPRGILNKSPAPGSTTEGGGGPSRPSSRRSQSVSFTLQAGSTRDGARSPSLASTRGGRRPLSVGSRSINLSSGGGGKSIPLMAIISPRPASFVNPPPSSSNGGYHHQYRLREPRRYSGVSASSRPPQATAPSVSTQQQMSPTSPRYSMSYVQSTGSANPESPVDEQHGGVQVAHGEYRGLPFQGWAFLIGFLVPFAWWIGSFTRLDYDAYARDAEAGVEPRFPPMEIITWRRRCRLMSVFSIIVYIPVIVLAVIFGR